ncbi:MAG: ABC transporter substrate-binding protein [Deltaproteobacteria bacterium]|nr:ABC transporter substrate-binding protein [Deltaproteobacteria bacterium]
MVLGHATPLLLLSFLAGTAADPVTRTEALVATFKAVKTKTNAAAPLSDADRKQNGATFALLDDFFDFDRITNDAIGDLKSRFAPDALKQFLANFKDVIRLVAYPNSGAALAKAKLHLKAGPKRDTATQADVDMTLRGDADDSDTRVTFHWEQRQGTWRIYDVSFDGSSLVKDYRNQFGRIVDKDKVEGLTSKVKKKLDERRKEDLILP